MKKILLVGLIMMLAACSATPEKPQANDETREVTVYFVSDTPRGFKLFSEQRSITANSDTFATQVISQLVSGSLQPLDPDYVNLWDNSHALNGIDFSDGTATVDLSLGKLNVGAEGEIRAIEQIVWTLTGLTPNPTQVNFLVNGEVVESFAGHVDTTSTFEQSVDYEVLNPLQITSILDGAELENPIIITGDACTFEANVVWELTQNGERIAGGFTTAGAACPERSPWKISLEELTSGEYVFAVQEFSAEDGSLFAIDTKSFSIN